MRQLVPGRRQAVDRVEGAAEEAERDDHDVLDEAGEVPRLRVDADDHAERGEQHEREDDGEREDRGLVHRHRGDREREGDERDGDQERSDRAAEGEAEVDLPRLHRRGEHVVDVAVEAGLEDRRGVVRVGRLDHRHRDEAGDDVGLVVDPVDLLDRVAEGEAEDEDEEEGRDDRRGDRLRPQLQDPVDLAGGQRDEAAVAFEEAGPGGGGRVVAGRRGGRHRTAGHRAHAGVAAVAVDPAALAAAPAIALT